MLELEHPVPIVNKKSDVNHYHSFYLSRRKSVNSRVDFVQRKKLNHTEKKTCQTSYRLFCMINVGHAIRSVSFL